MASLNTADYCIDNWQIEEGLPQVSVTSITQTPDGYLWLGTFNGLARFDGMRFTVFDEGNTPALGSSRIVRLDVDAQGTLWIITEAGDLVRRVDGRFCPCQRADGWPGAGALLFLRDASKGLFVVDRARALWRIENGRLAREGTNPRPSADEPRLLASPDGSAWVWERGHASPASHRAFPLSALVRSNAPSGSHQVEAFAPSRSGGHWLATTTSVYRLNEGLLQGQAVSFLGQGTHAQYLIEDTQGCLWFGFPERGLVRWQPQSGSLCFGVGSGLADSHVSALFCDREGNIWVGTGQGGLHRVKRRLIRMHDTEGGAGGHVITSVTENNQGRIWVGVNGAGLHRWEQGQLRPVTEPAELRRYPLVYSVLADREGAVWIGLYGRTALRWHGDSVAVHKLDEDLARRTPWALFEDRAGAVWLGTESGLERYRDGHFTRYTRNDGLSSADVRALAEARDGTLYVGTRGGGLNCMRGGRFTCYTDRDGLAANQISVLYVDEEDTLWIGTANGGLGRFQQGRFATLTVKDGLPSNTISALTGDNRGHLWLGSNRGLIRIPRGELNAYLNGHRRALAWQAFGRSDGLNSLGCGSGAQPACCKARDGKLWFATIKGLAVVDPLDLPLNPLPPPVVIEEVLLDERRLAADEPTAWDSRETGTANPGEGSGGARGRKRSPADDSSGGLRFERGDKSPTLVVPPGVHRVEFRFAGLSLVAPEKVRFRYQLENFDAAWMEAGMRRTAPYTRIPAGRYCFRVAACNNDGVWNEEGAALAVLVLPEWWQTWWFRGGVAAGALGLVGGAVEVRLRRLRRERLAQQAFARRLLESQEDERKRIAAELHDSLGQDLLVIKNRAMLGLRHPAATATATEHFSEISQLASQSLEEVREISRNLRPYQLDRLGLTKAIQSMVSTVTQASGIVCALELDPLEGLLAPPMEIHFYRIAQELLNNVVKHSQAASVTVRVKRRHAAIRLEVQDDGRGFDCEKATHPAPPRGGLGLSGIAERVRLLRGTARCDSQPAGGTRWTIEVPVAAAPTD